MITALSEGLDEHLQRVSLQALPLLRSEDIREAFTAFLEQRQPKFEGK